MQADALPSELLESPFTDSESNAHGYVSSLSPILQTKRLRPGEFRSAQVTQQMRGRAENVPRSPVHFLPGTAAERGLHIARNPQGKTSSQPCVHPKPAGPWGEKS